MFREINKSGNNAANKAVPQSEMDYLRQLAEMPLREMASGMTQFQSRDIVIHRDSEGRTIRSTEHIHEEKLTNIDSHWAE